MGTTDFKHIIEALLFVADEPLSAGKIAQVITGIDARQVRRLIDQLRSEYDAEGRAFTIEELAGGFRMLTRARFHPYLKGLFRQPRQPRLSAAALETLAIVAYKQPINRAEIEAIRGVDCSGVLQRLLEYRLIKIVGRSEELGRPLLYGTTKEFLEHFGLRSIRDLPSVEELVEPTEPDAAASPEEGAEEDTTSPPSAQEESTQEGPEASDPT